MIRWPDPLWPVKQALICGDFQIIDAGNAAGHAAISGKFPVLIAVGAGPIGLVVAAFIGKTHGDTVSGHGPMLFDQAVFTFLCKFAGEKSANFGMAGQKLAPIAPLAGLGIGLCHRVRVATVPGVFGHAHFLVGGGVIKGRQRWAGHGLLRL